MFDMKKIVWFTLDTTTGDAILKDVYEGPLREEINQATKLLNYFTEGDVKERKWEGRQVIIPLHKSRNSGVKSIAIDSGLLPAAGNQGSIQAKVPIKKTMGRIQITADILKAASSDRGSFIRALELEQKFLVKDVSRERNRQLAGFGQGTLAVVGAGAASATQALINPGGVVGTVNATRFTPVNKVVAFTDPTGATLRGVRTVISISDPNITVDSSVTTTTSDLVSTGTTVGSTEGSFGTEMMGILGLIDGTSFVSNLFSIDRTQAANAFFKANVISNVGVLNPDILNRGLDNTNEVSGMTIDRWLAHYSIKREIFKLVEADKRYNVNPGQGGKTFDAGPGMKGDQVYEFFYGGLPGTTDKDLPYGTLFGLSDGLLEWYPETKGAWADEDGTILLRTATQDQYEARWRVQENTFIAQPNAFVRFDGVTATVTTGVFSL